MEGLALEDISALKTEGNKTRIFREMNIFVVVGMGQVTEKFHNNL